jgi:hypothetical protein
MATENKTTDIWKELRKPFPSGTVGKLPKPYKKDSPKGKCSECGGYHGLPAVHLDYVGHAAVTDRLNSVAGPDNWSLEPIAYDQFGSPVTDSKGQFWCKLTILEASKLCVGDGATSAKELLGDALRNGAMRFGIALDLWTKDELESHLDQPELKNEKPTQATVTPTEAKPEPSLSSEQIAELLGIAKKKGHPTKEEAINFLNVQAMGDFTQVPAAEFETFKKLVIGAGWQKPAEDVRADDAADAIEGAL